MLPDPNVIYDIQLLSTPWQLICSQVHMARIQRVAVTLHSEPVVTDKKQPYKTNMQLVEHQCKILRNNVRDALERPQALLLLFLAAFSSAIALAVSWRSSFSCCFLMLSLAICLSDFCFRSRVLYLVSKARKPFASMYFWCRLARSRRRIWSLWLQYNCEERRWIKQYNNAPRTILCSNFIPYFLARLLCFLWPLFFAFPKPNVC